MEEPLHAERPLLFILIVVVLFLSSSCAEQLEASNGDSLQFEQDGDVTTVMNGDSQANIVDANIVVDNGIIHILDGVLVPSNLFFSPIPGGVDL